MSENMNDKVYTAEEHETIMMKLHDSFVILEWEMKKLMETCKRIKKFCDDYDKTEENCGQEFLGK